MCIYYNCRVRALTSVYGRVAEQVLIRKLVFLHRNGFDLYQFLSSFYHSLWDDLENYLKLILLMLDPVSCIVGGDFLGNLLEHMYG